MAALKRNIDNHILKAYSLHENAEGDSLSDLDISREIKSSNLAWVHLDADHKDTQNWLKKECEYLDHIIISGLLAEETRPRIEQIDDGIFLILRCVNLNKDSDPEDMVSIRMWIDQHRIITVQKRNVKSINNVEKLITSGTIPKTSGAFLCLLISNIFKEMEPILASLDEIMDDLEESLIEMPDIDLRSKLVKIRKQAIVYRRYMIPQRDALGILRNINLSWMTDIQKRTLQESHNHMLRYIEDLDAVRERSQIVKDELTSLLSDKLNKNMYILSVIAAIFLPLGFLTGLLGVNVGGIPGSQYPYSFYIFSGILVALVAVQIILFKKLKWF